MNMLLDIPHSNIMSKSKLSSTLIPRLQLNVVEKYRENNFHYPLSKPVNVVLMLNQRRRRWSNIKSALDLRLASAAILV